MVKIQVDLTDDEDKIVEIHKAKNRIETKEATIKYMVRSFEECEHDWERLEDKKYQVTRKDTYHSENWGDFHKIVERCKNCGAKRKDNIRL